MKLSEVVGQERAIAVLRESIARGRLHHALLFAGPEGVGKRATALALAARLLCEQGGDDGCGECETCRGCEACADPETAPKNPVTGLHFETFERPDPEKPVSERNRPRKTIGIDQVRSLQGALTLSALRGRPKIAIVDEAQALTPEAQNAFLKTLEEPPGNTIVILVARNAGALLPTVRSRCQRIPFTPLPDALVERLLRERHGRSAEDARRLAAWAAGSPGLALAVDAKELADAERRLEELLDGWKGHGYSEVRDAVDALTAQAEPLGLSLLLHLLRRRLRRAAGVGRETELTPPGKTGSLDSVLRAARHAYRAAVDLERNANPSIALERMWLGIGESLADAG